MDIVSKITGDSLTATEFNQIPNELENTISSTGQTPNDGDLFQVSKSIADYTANGDFYTDSGAADAYVLAAQGSKQAPTSYATGTRVRFSVGNTNTGASTVNVATLGVKSIKRQDGSALSIGDMVAGEIVELEYDSTNFLLKKEILEIGAIRDVSRNLVIENNSGTPNSKIDITADEIMLQNSVGVAKRVSSVSHIIDITTSGANGLDVGSEASDTWYFIFEIAKADGTKAGLLSISSTAPTMPSGYTFKALAGAIYNDSGNDFITIRQDGSIVKIEEFTALSAGGATSPTQVDITGIVPTTAKRIIGTLGVLDNTSTANSLATIQDSNALNILKTRATVLTVTDFSPFNGSSDLYYSVGQATTDLNIFITGWEY